MAKHLLVVEGYLKGLVLNLEEKDKYLIGRDPDLVDLILEDSTVSRKHAICFKKNDHIFIKDLSKTNPILINNNPIKKAYQLKEDDKIKIGQNIFAYSEKDIKENYKKEAEDYLSKSEEKEGYDTIFEEKVEEEPAFSNIISQEIILKVISGPNAGAEFGMEKNCSYIIGKDPKSCDIVFNDLSVSKNHAKISLDENNNIFIEDLNSKNGTIIDGEKIKEKRQIFSENIISLGTTSFIVWDQKKETETIYSVPIIKKPKIEELSWKEKPIPKKILVIGTATILTVFITFLTFFSLFKAEKVELKKIDPLNEIQKVLEKFEAVNFSYNPQGNKLFLVGHILTSIDQEQLLYDINKLSFVEEIENNLIIDEFVWKNTNDIINDNPAWRGVSIHSPKAGVFVISGYLKNIDDAENILDYLNSTFPYVDRLENRIIVESILKKEIDSELIIQGLIAISFQINNGEIILAGRYSEDNRSNFEKFLKNLKTKQGVRSIKNLAIETDASAARIDLTKDYTISGFASTDTKKEYVIINDKIFNIGDFLDDMKITDIKDKTIYLEKDGLKYKINYKE
ncbi:MAG: hypothetical protein AMS24_00290 [Chlamydiae bacterium SM23_39]|nr:MAG: hypothetical protein AMS24_00290 [Chlamydiae bacterium SM23_39]